MYHFILDLVMYVLVFKALTIGSEFSFYHWFKYGKEYTKWYYRRPKFTKPIDPKNPVCPTCGDTMFNSGLNRLKPTYICPSCNKDFLV